jgi:hypothetical protein
MRLVSLAFSASLIFAADLPKTGPQPIPASRHEEISRALITAQDAQLHTRLLRDEAEKQIKIAQDAEQQAIQSYVKLVQKLQVEFHAEGCTISIEKTWTCPTPANAKTEGAPAK